MKEAFKKDWENVKYLFFCFWDLMKPEEKPSPKEYQIHYKTVKSAE
jgi:hypothetical protein